VIQCIKSVLVGLTEEGEEEPASALSYGLSLANQAGAYATVQAASLKVVLTHTFVRAVAEVVTSENDRRRRLSDLVAERARGEAAAAGVVCTAESPQLTYTDLRNTFTAQAHVHDLTVLDAEPIASDVDRGLIEAVLFESGRPVVVVPPGCNVFATRRVVVAWDGSGRAARALHDAMPLLRAAEAVEVVSVVGEKDLSTAVPGAEVAPHLARHGVSATVKDLVAKQGDVAETLRSQAGLFRADLIVMGAFAHSWIREMVLGGVTQSLLKESPVPLFMSY
jgi:nucleotide-binding universal stress UspA family protein